MSRKAKLFSAGTLAEILAVIEWVDRFAGIFAIPAGLSDWPGWLRAGIIVGGFVLLVYVLLDSERNQADGFSGEWSTMNVDRPLT